MSQRPYPRSIEELDLDAVIVPGDVLVAVRAFARARPWRGTVEERKAKFIALHEALASALNVPAPRLIFSLKENEDSGKSAFIPLMNVIVLHGRLSVISMLHEWGHYLHGPSEYVACAWSLSIFKTVFPKSFGKLRFDGHFATAGE